MNAGRTHWSAAAIPRPRERHRFGSPSPADRLSSSGVFNPKRRRRSRLCTASARQVALPPHSRSQRAFVLVAVLVVVMLASMVAVSLMFRLRSESMGAAAAGRSEQAFAAAMSGIYQAIEVAAAAPAGSLAWQDHPARFRSQLVSDDGVERWYFTVFCAGGDEDAGPRFGLSDEASKLNILNTHQANLERLPEVTTERAQALRDFVDPDDLERPDGAETAYYRRLPFPYPANNDRLASLEETLLVRGIFPALLMGEDANLNFQLDPNEDDGAATFPPDNSNGNLNRGLRQFLTVSSYDLNLDKDRLPRLPMNEQGLTFFQLDVPPQVLNFIDQMRSNKVLISHPAELLEASWTIKQSNGTEVVVASGVGAEELPILLDQVTATRTNRLEGLINLNTASIWVLQSIPGLDLSTAESIVSARTGLTVEQRQTTAWIYQQHLVDADQFKRIAPQLTARSLQFSFHVVGYGLPSGQYRVLEVIIDLATPRPSITYLRDITQFGLPFRLEDTAEHEAI